MTSVVVRSLEIFRCKYVLRRERGFVFRFTACRFVFMDTQQNKRTLLCWRFMGRKFPHQGPDHYNTIITIVLQCGPMSNVMAALANIGGTLCSTLQSLADAHY